MTIPATAATDTAVAWSAPYPGGWARDFRFGEWLGDPVTPLFETWLLPTLERAFWAALRRIADMPTPQPTYVVVNGWYFTSLNFWPRRTIGWLWRLARHPKLLRVMFQFVPALADRALAPWVREWRDRRLPQYRAVVEAAQAELERSSSEEAVGLIDRVGGAVGEYFAWIALVAGAGYKTEAALARFYGKHVSPRVSKGHQALVAGVTDTSAPLGGHALHSLDWWFPTLGELDGEGGTASVGGAGERSSAAGVASAAREAAEAAVRAGLADRLGRLREFERLLATTRRYATLREKVVGRFTLGWPVLRRAALRLGKELVGVGALGAREEVFFLTRREVVQALRPGGSDGLAERAAERRREWERRRRLSPPLRLGEPPAVFKRGLDDLRAAFVPAAGVAHDGAVVRGVPASAGRASGRVRVIRGPAEFGTLRPGEVLVAPAWTPLFGRAAAVVTDTGGVLAHASLVAREYGIPAVVGTGDATARLRDGQAVVVDGDTGVVELALSQAG